ncbi:AAA family ATPase, partial [Methylomagnum sp.]
MLKSLSLENFTVFSSAQFEFSPGINVIVGENGTGKTHLLKAAYCLNRAWPDLMLNRSVLSRKRAEVYFEERLLNLFQPDHLAKLVRRNKQRSKLKSEVTAFIPTILIATENERRELSKQFPFGSLTESLLWELIVQSGEEIELATNASLDASIIPETAAVNSFVPKSIFLPSKEIVSFYEGLSGLLEQYKIKLDATYKDMARNFDFPELNNPPNLDIISEIEDKLGGYLALEGRRLIFVEKDGNKLETPLLAEGVRKLAILPYFIRHGLIQMKGETLFWDEPETNL